MAKRLTDLFVSDSGLTLKNTSTGDNGDNKPSILTLASGETDIQAADVIGAINFQAPDEETGSVANLVCAGIEAVSEGDFSSTSNATKLSFKTGSSATATEQVSLGSDGTLTTKHILPADHDTYDLGSDAVRFRDLYLSTASIWLGDEHHIGILNGEIKMSKRDKNVLPSVVDNEKGTDNDAAIIAAVNNQFGAGTVSSISDMKLEHILYYYKQKTSDDSKTLGDIYNSDTNTNVDNDFANDFSVGSDLKLSNTALLHVKGSQVGILKVGTIAGDDDDKPGKNLEIMSGASTGNANGGDIIFKTSTAGDAGSSVNTQTERMRLTHDGTLILKYDAEEYVTHAVSSTGVYSITTTDALNDSGAITLDTVDSITLDSDTAAEGIVYAAGGVDLLRIFNSSSDVIFKTLVDSKDIQFQQYDGNLLLDINYGGWVGIHNAAAGPGELRIYEDTDNGSFYTGFKAGNITTSITYTMPLADGSANEVLSTNGSGTLSWVTSNNSSAANDITTGDAAVTIATTEGNITIDAQGNDTDIIFKGTDNNSDITALTLDMSEAGAATFNGNITSEGGIIHLKGEKSSAPSAPGDGEGGKLYTKADGKIYWNSNEVAETSLLEGVISKGMTVQTQHTDYTGTASANPAAWAAIDSTNYIATITPTSSSSKVLISVNCHIGIDTSNDVKYYGLRLYKNVGGAGWAEVTAAKGAEVTGYDDDRCWISDNTFSGLNTTHQDFITNLSGTFLDSPSSTSEIKYALYWKIKLGTDASGSGTIYLNRVNDESTTYQPRLVSSITAQEIWNTGTGYNPNNVIYQDGSNAGIGTSSPGTLLQLEGTAPYLTLKNSTAENTEGGCASKIIFEDHDDTALAQIQASHDGTEDDTKGDLIFSTHNNSSLTEGMRIDSSQNVIIPDGKLMLGSTSVSSNADELNYVDGVTAGTATASKALVLDASKDIGTIRNLTIDGTFSDGNYTFDTNGNVLGLGTVGCGAISSTGDMTIYDDTINADTSLSIGTSATEALIIQVLNGDANNTAEEIKFMSKTASGTANHGKMTFSVDESNNILEINDSGINVTGTITGTLATEAQTAITSVGTLTGLDVVGDNVTFASTNANDPLVIIKNTTNDTDGARLRFVKDKGAAGADNDYAGLIEFYADDDNQDQVLFAKISAQVADASNGAEGGKLSFGVSKGNGTFKNVIEINGSNIITDTTCDYNNDPTITMNSTASIKLGMAVFGTGIPSGAMVSSITNATQFELSASTTGGSVTNGTLTFISFKTELTTRINDDVSVTGNITNPSGVLSFNDDKVVTRNDIYAKNIHLNYNSWVQLGSDIDGEATGDLAAMVSLSANGKIVAVGSCVSDGGGHDRGHCSIYEFNESTIAWDQKGSDIDGEANSDISGNPVTLSADGNTVGIGARYNDGINGGSRTNDGHVRIYRWRLFTQSDSDNSTYHHTSRTQDGSQTKPLIITANTSTAPSVGSYYWTQLGTDIDGADISTSERFGKSVGLSANGNTFVGGGWYYSDGSVSYRGRVRIFDYNGSAWVKRGDDILGDAVDQEGNMVSISYDGNIIATGARLDVGGGTNAGRVRIYYWNGSAWTQRGGDIEGVSAEDQEGLALSLSGDGNVIATGSYFHDGGAMDGHVRVFYWDGSAWTQRGINLEAEAADDGFGRSLDISADGNTLLVGGYLNDDGPGDNAGHARVFRWDGVTWNQIGADIDGTAAGDQFGWSVNINGDGNILAIGGVIHDSSRGHVQIYTLGEYINNLSVGEVTGATSISFSKDNDATLTVSDTASGTAGKDLTISAGSTPAASGNTDGGDLILKSGFGDGTGSSIIGFHTSTATTDNAVSERMRIHTNGYVGIGTTSPATLLHLKQTTAGTTLRIQDKTNTVPNPKIELMRGTNDTFGSDDYTDWRIDNNIDGYLQFHSHSLTAGLNTRMTMLSNGNVGIGTTTPGVLLHLRKTTGSPAIIRLHNDLDDDLGVGPGIEFMRGANDTFGADDYSDWRITNDAGSLKFYTAGTDTGAVTANVMSLNYTGNVGIGTTNPILPLHVLGAHAAPATSGNPATGILRLTQSGTVTMDMGTLSDNNSHGGWIQCHDNNNAATHRNLFLNPNGGNVGIGETEPIAKLDVNGDIFCLGSNIWMKPSHHFANDSEDRIRIHNDGSNCYWDWLPGSMFWRYNSATKMTLTASGNLGIGTTGPSTKLHVNGYQTCYDSSLIPGYNNTGDKTPCKITLGNGFSPQILVRYPNNSYTDSTELHFKTGGNNASTDNTASRMVIKGKTGHVGIGFTSSSVRLSVNGQTYSSSGYISSDDRIKYNEQVINSSSALNLINQLSPQKYEKITEEPSETTGNWMPTDEEWVTVKDEYSWIDEAGLIAQEVRDIPELAWCVNGDEVDSEGNQTTLRLNYNDIYAYHISATKELSTQLNAEKAKTATMETKVSTLETQVADLLARVTALENP